MNSDRPMWPEYVLRGKSRRRRKRRHQGGGEVPPSSFSTGSQGGGACPVHSCPGLIRVFWAVPSGRRRCHRRALGPKGRRRIVPRAFSFHSSVTTRLRRRSVMPGSRSSGRSLVCVFACLSRAVAKQNRRMLHLHNSRKFIAAMQQVHVYVASFFLRRGFVRRCAKWRGNGQFENAHESKPAVPNPRPMQDQQRPLAWRFWRWGEVSRCFARVMGFHGTLWAKCGVYP